VDSALPQLAGPDTNISSIDSSQGRNVNSSKIKVDTLSYLVSVNQQSFQTMTRGYSDEADKLLNYLVNLASRSGQVSAHDILT
jgi:meiosis-specific protein